MFRTILALGLSLSCLTSSAFANPEGIAAAEAVCQNAGFQSEILRCTKITAQAQYFEKGAVDLCANLGFKSEVINCLSIIRDKSYTEQVLATCGGMGFGSKITECLEAGGRSIAQKVQVIKPIVTPQDSTRSLVAQALGLLESGQIKEAKAVLNSLLVKLAE